MRRKPTSPGEILIEEFLIPLGISQKELAEHLRCDYKVINRIANEQASVTPEMATRLAAAFNTTPDFWLYRARLGFANLSRARQSPIEACAPNEEDHSRIGKDDEEDRLGKVAASSNSQNLSGRGINAQMAMDLWALRTKKLKIPPLIRTRRRSRTFHT
jgi:addiction module HigA family antidote